MGLVSNLEFMRAKHKVGSSFLNAYINHLQRVVSGY